MNTNFTKFFVFLFAIASFAACSNKKGTDENYKMGLTFDDAGYNKIPKKATLTRALYDNLPSSASLQQFCPKVERQNNQTCVGWSSSYYARTILYAREKQLSGTSQISDNTFSPGFTYRAASMVLKDVDLDCGNGSLIDVAMQIMQRFGVLKYNDFREECYQGEISEELVARANPYRIQTFTRLIDASDSREIQLKKLKKSLAEGNPVLIGMETMPSFLRCRSEIWQPEGGESSLGGHAICVMAYDDNKAGGAFQIINSWGTAWGNNGFAWIKYDDFFRYVRYACEMVVNIPPPPKPQPEIPKTEPKPEPKKEEPKPAPAPVVVQKSYLSGQLKLVLDSGNEMPISSQRVGNMDVVPANTPKPTPITPTNTRNYFAYKAAQPYPSGTRFRIYLDNNEPAYVYAFSMDNTRKTSLLFPYNSNISPVLNYAKNTVALPDEDHYIQLDNQTGTDILCLLYSKDALDIGQICQQMEGQEGTFFEILYKTLNGKIIAPNFIQYEEGNMKFKAEVQNGFVVPIVVEVSHK